MGMVFPPHIHVVDRFFHFTAPEYETIGAPPTAPRNVRWQCCGDAANWFGTTSHEAARCEFVRHAPPGVDPNEIYLRIGLVEANVRVLDLRALQTREHLGIDLGDLTGDSYEVTQRIARDARSEGFEGILSPSASLSGASTLVVFPHAMEHLVLVEEEIVRFGQMSNKFARRV
jgi:hypothetical protein